LLAAKIDYFSFYVLAQFFVGAGIDTFTHKVYLGKNPSRIVYQDARAHKFVYFNGGQKDGYHGKMKELMLIKHLQRPF